MNMRYSRVLLINPPTQSFYGALRPPVGLAYLSEVLKYNGIACSVVDMLVERKIHAIYKKIDEFEPDLIGLTLYSFSYNQVYRFMHLIKQYTDTPIIVGGPHVSILREQVLEECPAIDYGVTFEGEETLVELCSRQDHVDILGLLYRTQGKICYTGDRSFIKNLDAIPFPHLEQFDLSRYLKEKVIFSSRGCPYQCTYCAAALAMGRTYRMRSTQNVVDELEYWYQRGYRQFHFLDDNFSQFKNRVYEICDEIEKRSLEGLFIRCTNGLRADRVDRALLSRMREVGFKCLAFGVEAGNNKILKNIKKGECIEDIERAIQTAVELDYDVYLTFLVGSPGETWDDLNDSVTLALKYPVFRVDFYNIVPYPRTELFNWLENNGYLLIKPEVYLNSASSHAFSPIFETPELPLRQRKKALNYCRSIERTVLFNTVARKLKRLKLYAWQITLLSWLLSRDYVQKMLFLNTGVRKYAESLRRRYYRIKT
ncbi:MAG: radical SAM protein [Elusimicrobia bacterium]|nr:radical SAM protein [Elusimicrobiota bacterium]